VRKFGELEAAVMDRLWSREAPATVREVLTDLSGSRQLAYTTVLTVMDNLHKKGWLRREPAGRAYRYAPVAPREEYGARLLHDALRAGGDPAGTLLRFVGQMSPGEAAALRDALAAHDRENGDS
jgi:predicted transcriptional regulator